MIEYRLNTTGLTEAEINTAHARICPACGATLTVGDWPFCRQGRGHDPFIAKNLAVIDDTIVGGMVIENMASHPITFYSKSDYRREMKARGLINRVEHIGVPGRDTAPHTSRWV